MRRGGVGTIAVIAGLAFAAPAHAGSTSTLTEVGEATRWSGSISDSAVPHPAACTAARAAATTWKWSSVEFHDTTVEPC